MAVAHASATTYSLPKHTYAYIYRDSIHLKSICRAFPHIHPLAQITSFHSTVCWRDSRPSEIEALRYRLALEKVRDLSTSQFQPSEVVAFFLSVSSIGVLVQMRERRSNDYKSGPSFLPSCVPPHPLAVADICLASSRSRRRRRHDPRPSPEPFQTQPRRGGRGSFLSGNAGHLSGFANSLRGKAKPTGPVRDKDGIFSLRKPHLVPVTNGYRRGSE